MPGTRDLAELLNVNVDELARARALVANRLLEPDPAKPAHADPRQDPRHRRKRHPERLSDLSRCEAQPAQLHDRLDPVLFGAIGDPPRGRGTVRQTRLTLAPVTPNPLPRATDADARSRSRRGHGRTLLDDQHTQPPPTAPTERRVTVKLHPVSSLDWGALTAPSFQGDPDEPTCSGTTPRNRSTASARAGLKSDAHRISAGAASAETLRLRQRRRPGVRRSGDGRNPGSRVGAPATCACTRMRRRGAIGRPWRPRGRGPDSRPLPAP